MKVFYKFLITAWIVIAFFNVFFNMVKSCSEIKEWGFLSDNEKRHKIFGDLHDFLVLIRQNTKKDDHILIFSKDGEEYQTLFLSLYYLYPRIITTTIDGKEFTNMIKTKKYKYIAAYNSPIRSIDYEKTASYSAKTTSIYGSIYRLK